MITRRLFLGQAMAACAADRRGFAQTAPDAAGVDPNLVTLFSDTHVTRRPDSPFQRDGLARCVSEVLALSPRPAHVIIYGDLAHLTGEPDDYALLKELLAPLAAGGVRWHPVLGNHDRHEAFFAAFPEYARSPVPGKMVSVVETPRADFILLDSCLDGPVQGTLDEPQRAWLRETLSQYAKPVFVGAHHPVSETGVNALLAATPACCGYIHGHNHVWDPNSAYAVWSLGLPSTGHWGDIGHVMVRLAPDAATFTNAGHDYYPHTPKFPDQPPMRQPEWTARAKKKDAETWTPPLAVADVGFVPLFNGRDLAGWTPLNVPEGTFFVRDGLLVTTGKPTGLLRTERMFENFVIDFEWRHMQAGGNSGLFVWADGKPANGTPFPRGIEVQILDPGFNVKGKNDWYSVHGDIFPVNGTRLTLAGRVSPNGQRSFPAEERTKASPEWNHYRVAGVDGELSLSVNGKEVTIAYGASPRKGYLMLESEGAECQFRHIRIKELPTTQPKPEEVAVGH